MEGDLLLLLLHLPGSLQLPKAFDHPIHRPQSFTYHQYAVNPTLEAFDHPEHTPQHYHPEVTRTHPSHPHLGYPLEVCMYTYNKHLRCL